MALSSRLSPPLLDWFHTVLPERGSEAGAGARKRVFQKMAGSEAWSEAFLYIYIFKRKHVECQTRCKIYETCMFVILPIYEMPSRFHIIHHSIHTT